MADYFLYILMYLLPLVYIFQFGMIIDCLANKSIEKLTKFGWLLFIFFVPGVGAFFYFIFGSSWWLAIISGILSSIIRILTNFIISLQLQYKWPKRSLKSEQSQPKDSFEPMDNYDQGYQAQQTQITPIEERKPGYYQHYEEPQASYPEQLQQQKDIGRK